MGNMMVVSMFKKSLFVILEEFITITLTLFEKSTLILSILIGIVIILTF